jgi:hypothetical protein
MISGVMVKKQKEKSKMMMMAMVVVGIKKNWKL